MNSRGVLHLISYLTFVFGLAMVICCGVSRIFNESLDYVTLEINDEGYYKDRKIIIADALLD